MSLTKNAVKKDFENDESGMDDTVVVDTAAAKPTADERIAAATKAKAEVKPEVKAEAAAETAAVVTAAAASSSLATRMIMADPFKKLENAIKVDYNTLDRIMVTNGNVQNKETKGLMGDTCVLELISIQKHWVMSPGGLKDDEESLEFLKYSDDGINVRDGGGLLTTYRDAALTAGYKDARIVERLILVGMLVDAGKLQASMEGSLVQMDLAPRSKANFEKHRISAAFRIGRGSQKAEGAEQVRINCDVQSKGTNNWTDALFSAV